MAEGAKGKKIGRSKASCKKYRDAGTRTKNKRKRFRRIAVNYFRLAALAVLKNNGRDSRLLELSWDLEARAAKL